MVSRANHISVYKENSTMSNFNTNDRTGSDNSQIKVKKSAPVYVTGMQSMNSKAKCNKQFFLDEGGKVQKQPYQKIKWFKAKQFPINGIRPLAKLIADLSVDPYNFLVRGLSFAEEVKGVERNNENFPEHKEGTPWVMIDFDDIALPEGVDPLSVEAIEYGISLLPKTFHNVTYFFQHSSSAGISQCDGTLMKSGLNAHVFFWFNRRVKGKQLTAYLKEDSLHRNLVEIKTNKSGVAIPHYAFDVAVIRTPSQPHYIALPDLEEGVQCLLNEESRQGLFQKESDIVVIPELALDIELTSCRKEKEFVTDWKRAHGAVFKERQIVGPKGVSTYRSWEMPNNGLQKGRNCTGYKLVNDNSVAILEFDDEDSPGSWWVGDKTPYLARRFGDEAVIPLWELSENAFDMICHDLQWCSPVLTYEKSLQDDGYLPAIDDISQTKASLIIAPTGSGKTTRIAEWIKEQDKVVIYTAPTIALTKQMHEDLVEAEVNAGFYHDVRRLSHIVDLQCVVTTNKSLPRILRLLHYARPGVEPHIVIDEVHMGLDDFMKSNNTLKEMETIFKSADRLFFLTGTITDVQLSTLASILWHAYGELDDSNFRTFKFAAVKKNPLVIMEGRFFEPALLQLARDYKNIIDDGGDIPRTVLLVGTSKLKKYEILFDELGLGDYYAAVSRYQSNQEEIFQARVTDKPILIASPVFSLGINFEFDPERLWVSTGKIKMDVNQIVQAVNRGNRRANQCEVKLFAPVPGEAAFDKPNRLLQRLEVEKHVIEETTIQGVLEQHFHINRAAYIELRNCERNTKAAMGVLIESGLQNYEIVSCYEEAIPKDEDDVETLKDIRAQARAFYDDEIQRFRPRYQALKVSDSLVYLDSLKALRDYLPAIFEDEEKPLEHEIKSRELAVVAEMCDLTVRSHMEQVSISMLRKIFGDSVPFLTAQHYEKASDRKAIIEKLKDVLHLVAALNEVKKGVVDTYGFARLVRGKKLVRNGIKALASNEGDFHKLSRTFIKLDGLMVKYQRSSSKKVKEEIDLMCFDISKTLFKALGIRWVKAKDGNDYSQPLVPKVYDFDEASFRLQQTITIYQKASPEQRIFLNTLDRKKIKMALDWDIRQKLIATFEVQPPEMLPVSIRACEGCVFSRDLGCALGREVDWLDDLHPYIKELECPTKRPLRAESMESEHYKLGNFVKILPTVWSQKPNEYGACRGV